jgi:5-methylcytosine-specific restriction endonuclease McrA
MGKRKSAFNQDRIRVSGASCLYCGDPATTEDHFPPITFTGRGFLLPSCRLCNSMAGRVCSFHLPSRIRYVQEKLGNRLRSELRTPDWGDDELEELGEGLRREAERWQKLVSSAKRRNAWSAVAYLQSIAPEAASVLLDAECDITTWLAKPSWKDLGSCKSE